MAATIERHTEVHEAGHAVIAIALGLPVEGMTVVPDGEAAGHVIIPDQWAILDSWEARERWRDERTAIMGRILAYMAGAEAEIEILGNCHGGDGDDRLWISRMLEEIPSERTPAQLEERLRGHTRALVRRHRAAIERLAGEIAQSRSLSAVQLTALLSVPVTSVAKRA
ncbi:hypothetical protein KHC23_10905 [Ancylobacter dichloromethanicus]|uniref:Uncharacterized protein n=1 Tax=Ancylobacter dichloromethanicus TaxID=518825 RepID=A0A9W6MYT2_9HYPH|nr:hypothetical protein [Ancylobacter dichloromethanicus]MBS7554157.1 hypothetical protein [Ancylobacter dichloromethanicus]GLK71275.1 hypothetical protein GCM10017643_13900 [Ancylobacter dichloromethanicus]